MNHVHFHFPRPPNDPDFRCPRCRRSLQSETALLAHSEAFTNRCGIRADPTWHSFVDQYLGGLVGLSPAEEPGEWNYFIPREAVLTYGSRKNRELQATEDAKEPTEPEVEENVVNHTEYEDNW